MDYTKVLDELREICNKVGLYQLNKFRDMDLKFGTKSNISDLVTEVDQASEDMIITFLKEKYPDTSIIAEESGAQVHSESSYTWIIDPLDGTNNYASGLPIFSISIALCHDDSTVLGIVHAPYLNETYTAIRGQGAYVNAKKIQVHPESELNKCIVGTGFPYDKGTNPANNLDYFSNVLPQVRGVRRYGSAAYDLCLVAAGNLNAYWELDLKRWDVEAGSLIVKEAGGHIVPFRNDRSVAIIAGNADLCQTLLNEHHKVFKEG